MNEYDIVKAFQEMEEYLIKSMSKNLMRHLAEEDKEEINWSAWQTEQLKSLKQFRQENEELFKGYFSTINDEIDIMIQKCYNNGELEQEIEILKALREGYVSNKQETLLEGAFFVNNKKKLRALIDSVNADMQKAETSILRMVNDQYRQIIYNSQVFYNTGTLSTTQAVDKATKDFLSRGINSIQYKDGKRVPIDSYVEMALRTANKRANIMGAADKRDEWNIHTVQVPSRGTGCPFCVPWQGKILIDDVFSSGSKRDGKYPLLSSAMGANFLHPMCKDTISTYFEGVNEKPKRTTQQQREEKVQIYNLQQRQRYNERQIRKYTRLELGSVDKENIDYYRDKKNQWLEENKKLINSHSNILREDTTRYKTRGILQKLTSKDKKPKIKLNINDDVDLSIFKIKNNEHIIEEDVKMVNPNYSKGREYKINCQRCVPTYEMRARGYDVQALPKPSNDILCYGKNTYSMYDVPDVIYAYDLGSRSKTQLKKIKELMKEYGDGARAEVRVGWKGANSGHVFVAEQVNGETRFIDPQNGDLDCEKYFDYIRPSVTWFLRIDNLKINKIIEQCCK